MMPNSGDFKLLNRDAQSNAEILPYNWEKVFDHETQRYFFVDHNLKQTTWLNPMDTRNKPRHPSDCRGDELPCGWERMEDPILGPYYADHIEHKNHWTDPVTAWRNRENKLNQHHHSNSHQITQMVEYSNHNNHNIDPIDNNNHNEHDYTNYPTPLITSNISNSQSKPELATSINDDTHKIEKCMSNLNMNANVNSNRIAEASSSSSSQQMNTNVSLSSSQFDASLLDLMENRFGKNDESFQV